VRATAPEILHVAKTQHSNPEEVLRTLVEAETAARQESNTRAGLRAAGFPVAKTLDEFTVSLASVPQATFDYLRSLEWLSATENLCLVGPPAPARVTCSSRSVTLPLAVCAGVESASPVKRSQFTDDGHPVGNMNYDKATGPYTGPVAKKVQVAPDRWVELTDDEIEAVTGRRATPTRHRIRAGRRTG